MTHLDHPVLGRSSAFTFEHGVDGGDSGNTHGAAWTWGCQGEAAGVVVHPEVLQSVEGFVPRCQDGLATTFLHAHTHTPPSALVNTPHPHIVLTCNNNY